MTHHLRERYLATAAAAALAIAMSAPGQAQTLPPPPADAPISAEAATAGYVVKNTGPGPLVALRYFGPDVHADLPTHGRQP